jgi:hypothetical protein
MYISASAPEAPPLSETTIGCFIRLFFWIAACIMRAIWSEAPPAPAATTISTGFVGSHAAIAGAFASTTAASAAIIFMIFRTRFPPYVLVCAGVYTRNSGVDPCRYLAASRRRVQATIEPGAYDFRMWSQALGRAYLPFQLGVRLLRKASIPSRKSSLI